MKKHVRIFHRALGQTTAALMLTGGVWSAAADQYSTTVLADHPTAFWQLNEQSGTTAVDSAGSHNGIYTNAVINQPGYTLGSDPAALSAAFGSSVGQSSDSYVGGMALDFATNANAEFSAEAWVQATGPTSGSGIFGKGTGGGGEEFYLDCGGTGGGFRFFARSAAGGATNANSSITPDSNWHYVAGVCDQANNKIVLYVDGVQVATTPMTGGIKAAANANMNIGSRQSSATSSYDLQFSGDIANVAAYNYALTPAQVLNHYYAAGIAPVITVQPTNSITVGEGGTVTVAVAATGSPVLDYNWNINGTVLQDGTNASLTITNISASLNGQYLYVVVSNAYGQAYGSPTYLTVNSGAPTLVTDVGPAQLGLYLGATHTYLVSASGTVPIYYQWLKNGTAISGATNSSYLATSTAGAAAYSVAVSNNFGGGSIILSSVSTLTGVAAPTTPYAAKIISDGPVAYYRLDEATGATNALDYLGGHNGTYNNVLLGLPGYSSVDPDTAAGFGSVASASSDSYVGEINNTNFGIPLIDFGAPTGSNAQFTIEAWVNGPAGQNPSGSAIVTKGITGSEEFVLDASGPNSTFRFFTRKPSNGATSQILTSSSPDGNWHYLVGVCDEVNGAISLYLDGNIIGQIGSLGATGLNSSSEPLSIGAQSSGFDYSYQFNGTVDEVAVYNKALTAAQITAHYTAAPLPPYFTSLPATNITALPGQNITLSSSSLGSTPRTNQWFLNSVAIGGQTNASLTINNIQPGTYNYFVKVSNRYGSTNSPTTLITVEAASGPPYIGKDLSDTARYTTLPLTYSITAYGSAPLYYYWYFNNNLVAAGTNSTYAIPSVTAADAGSYNCVVSNSQSTATSASSTLTVSAIPTNTYPKLIISDHPVAYFRLDEAPGGSTGYDYIGGNEGQYTTSSLIALGAPGYNTNLDSDTACRFGTTLNNSDADYLGNTISGVDFSQPNGGNGAFSLEAWVNGTNNGVQISGGAIVAKGGGGFEQFSLDCHFGFRFYTRNTANATGAANAQASPNLCGSLVGGQWQMDGKWHHVVGVCDQVNSNLLLYVDGTLIGPNIITNGVVPPLAIAYDLNQPGTGTNGTIAANQGIAEPTNTLNNVNTTSIGNRNKSIPTLPATPQYNLPFFGIIDDVALYNYALTPAQVANHYHTALGIVTQVSITFHVVNGQLVLTWPSGTLVSSTTVNGTYTPVVGAASPYTVTATGTQQFFRLKLN